jgi:hypothetical protein
MENFSMDQVFNFLTGSFAYSKEFQSMGMGLQGALIVRNGRNKDGSMNWFHALALSTIFAFGGGWFGFIWMGRPSSMITGADINVPCCIIAFLIANYTPLDIGLKLGNFFPVTLIITSAAQLFRCLGLIGFITFAFQALKDTPSPYYPIPLIGPILYGSLLGNMGAFFLKGFDGHLQGGIPFAFQNGKTKRRLGLGYSVIVQQLTKRFFFLQLWLWELSSTSIHMTKMGPLGPF